MNRKLIRQGSGGFTIYLPKGWVEKQGLSNGEEVSLSENNGDLIINTSSKQKTEETIALTEKSRRNLKNILTNLYRKGVDIIKLQNVNNQTLDSIRQTLPLLLGFEVIETSENTAILENISEPASKKYDVLLRRIFLIIKETQRVIISEAKKEQHSSEVEEHRKNLDKFVLFCKRVSIKKRSNKDPIAQWELLTFLTHINHAQYYLFKSMEGFIADEETKKLLEEVENYFELYYRAYFLSDSKYVLEINAHKPHFEELPKAIENSTGKKALVLSQIQELFRMIQLGTSPILMSISQE